MKARSVGSRIAAGYRWLALTSGSLKERSIRGSVWVFIGEAINRTAGLAKIAVLGRLLSPADFGLLGVALVVQQWIESFTQTGINAALIQKRQDIGAYLNTAWTAQLIRSVVVSAAIFLAAPVGGAFFRNGGAVSAIRAVAAMTLLWGLTNPAVVFLRRELDFRRDVAWRSAGAVTGLVVGVGAGLLWRNAWALVFSLVCARAAETVASYWVHPYRPRPELVWSRLRELMRFGKWIFWTNMIGFLEANLDSMAVGRLLGTAPLGRYQVAQHVGAFPIAQMGAQVHGILFPAFSRMASGEGQRRAFLSAVRLLALVLLPAASFLTVFARPILHLVLGARWVDIGPVFQFLVWAAVAKAMTGVTGPLFLGLGKPSLSFLGLLLKLVLIAGFLYPFVKAWGLTGIAAAIALASMVCLCYHLAVAQRVIQIRVRDFAGALLPAAGAAALFAAAAPFVSGAPWPRVFLLAAATLSSYSIILVGIFRSRSGLRLGV